jgi:FtsZ-binding cell division protein ZapB
MTAVRKAQTGSAAQSPAPGETNTSSAFLQVERDLLRQENQRLRYEIRRSQQRISELLGDQIDGTDAHSQSLLVQELTDQNIALSRQASEATQEAHRFQQELAGVTSDLQAAHSVNRSLMSQLNRSGMAQPAK